MNPPTYFSNKSPSTGSHQYKATNKTITAVVHVHCLILKMLGKIFMSMEETSDDIYTAIPRLTKIIRSGITFVSRNVR